MKYFCELGVLAPRNLVSIEREKRQTSSKWPFKLNLRMAPPDFVVTKNSVVDDQETSLI